MISTIIERAQEHANYLYDKWKYLILQEKCRLCKRLIHPRVENMNFELYGARPGILLTVEK